MNDMNEKNNTVATEPVAEQITLINPIEIAKCNYIIEVADDNGTIRKFMVSGASITIKPLRSGGMLVDLQ